MTVHVLPNSESCSYFDCKSVTVTVSQIGGHTIIRREGATAYL